MAAEDPQSTIAPGPPEIEKCAECGKTLTPGDRMAAGAKVFCQSCHESLRAQLESAVRGMSEDINYPNAALGAVLGGTAGVLVWWGFTVLAHWSIGIIAVGLGWAVGWGTVTFSGRKRSQGLQILSAAVATVCWVVANYLVNMTFVNQALAAQGDATRATFPPQSLGMFVDVFNSGFSIMKIVFLAIMVWEAWKFPRPLVLPKPASG